MPKKKVTPEPTEELLEQTPTVEKQSHDAAADEPASTEPVNTEAPIPDAASAEAGSPDPDDIPEILAVELGDADEDESGGEMLVEDGTSTEAAIPYGELPDDAPAPTGDGAKAADDGEAEAPPAESPMAESEPEKKTENETPAPEESPTAAPDAPKPPADDEKKSFYQLDFHALDRGLSPEQQQEWNSIYASYRGRSVLTGTVVGIDRHAISVRDRATGEMVRQEMYCAIVIPFRVRILIPATEMWPKNEERPPFVLRNMTGASIDFVIIHVDREGGFAIGSRRLAVRTRRYFFSTQPAMNRIGSRVKCRVLAVGPRRCLVECGGYDIDLTQREMHYTAIPDLRDEYRPGQELDCIVKNYNRDAGKLTISIKETEPNPFDGAELRHPEGSRRQAVIAGKYAGGVFCNLPDGAVCMCSYSFHYDDSAFAIGDKVIVAIQRYDFGKKQIYGKITAKW